MKAGDVGIADVIRAVDALRPNRPAAEVIVTMCGLSLIPEATPAPRVEPTEDDVAEADVDVEAIVTRSNTAEPLPPTVHRLKPVRQDAPPPPTLDPFAGPAAAVEGAPRVFEGLLTVRDCAEMLRLAASVPMLTERIDVDRVTTELAHARPLTNLPRLSTPSLALGAQVLVDVGDAMQPFFEDQQQLLQRLETSLRTRADVRYFADDPKRGTGSDRRRGNWKRPYTLPSPGTPVIALTDMGCGFPRRPHAIRAWLALEQQLQRRESRLVVFAPVRLARIPRQLRRSADLVIWDRSAVRRNVMQLVEVPG